MLLVSCADRSGKNDAGVDAGTDAAPSYELCPESRYEDGVVGVQVRSTDNMQEWRPATVVERLPGEVTIDERDFGPDEWFRINWADLPLLDERLEELLPDVGSDVEVRLSWGADSLGYAAIRTMGGELIFEGGGATDSEWQVFSLLPKAGAVPCQLYAQSPRCCCYTQVDLDVAMILADEQTILTWGETVEVEIGGVRFAASAQGAYEHVGGPCVLDADGRFSSVFLVRLDGLP